MLFLRRRTKQHRGRRTLPPWRYRVAGLAAAALAVSLVQATTGNASADRTAPPAAEAAADVVRVAEFLAECPYTHRAPDDPIVLPNLPGASHMHSFFGNDSTDAHSDLASLEKAGTSCAPRTDLSSYWVPTLYDGTKEVEPTGTSFYYLGEGVRDDVIRTIKPFPAVSGSSRGTRRRPAPTTTRSRAGPACTTARSTRRTTSSTVRRAR